MKEAFDASLFYRTEPWHEGLDATAFSSGMEKIDKYIKEQAERDMKSRVSAVFVLLEPKSEVIRGYYTLSSLGIVFDDLPKNVQRKLPRYPLVGATLLGRLGVDRSYKNQLQNRLGKNPRFGEFLLVDALQRALEGAGTVGSALMIIDVLKPTGEEIKCGVKNPMTFYKQYGFQPFPGDDRRVFKPMKTIENEWKQ